jgi:hypothetical protein
MHQPITPEIYQDQVLPVFETATEVLGHQFTEEDFVAYIRLWRKRELYFKRVPTPKEWNGIDWMGLCCAALDRDIILLRAGMDEILDCSTLGHEGGHLLSNHVEIVPMTAQQLLSSPQNLLKYVHFNTNDEPLDPGIALKEAIANEIGLLFTQCLIRKRTSLLGCCLHSVLSESERHSRTSRGFCMEERSEPGSKWKIGRGNIYHLYLHLFCF